MANRPDWDTYFLGIATAVAARADCTRRKVGAVLVDDERRIIATGYNGAPAGHAGCLLGWCPRGRLSYDEKPEHGSYDDCVAIHAEANALLYAYRSVRQATAYITHPACPSCLKLLAGAGLGCIVTPEGCQRLVGGCWV